jgi:hypothetical protein
VPCPLRGGRVTSSGPRTLRRVGILVVPIPLVIDIAMGGLNHQIEYHFFASNLR